MRCVIISAALFILVLLVRAFIDTSSACICGFVSAAVVALALHEHEVTLLSHDVDGEREDHEHSHNEDDLHR